MAAEQFNFSISRQYLTLLLIVSFLSCSMIFMLTLPIIYKCIIMILLMAYLASIIWRFCLLRAASSIRGLRQLDGGQWLLQMRDAEIEGNLLGDSTITRWVSILRFRVANRYRPLSCIIFSDSLTSNSYRKLIVQIQTAN